MSLVSFTPLYVAHLGRRVSARCHLCRLQLGSFPTRRDATSEADRHLRQYHREAVA